MSTLLLVHAHPDDESIFGGGAVIRAHHQGKRVVLVTCTGGELGEIHNVDEAATRPRLKEVREQELRRACEILGVDRLVLLGYRDSGMAGTPGNDDPASFNRAPLEEAAARLAAIIEEESPDVVVTYGPDGVYGHPDHIKAHKTALAAWELLAARDAAPARLWYAVIPQSGMAEFRKRLEESGQAPESFDGGAIMGVPDDQIQAVIDTQEFAERKKLAFQAHLTQNDPSSFFLNTPDDLFKLAFGIEFYSLAKGVPPAQQLGDLFEGLAPDRA